VNSSTIVITGAAGRIGTAVRDGLRRAGHRLVLVDIVAPAGLAAGERSVVGSITDRGVLDDALSDGADLVVHLGGHPREMSWADIADANIDGTQAVLERAQDAGVRRVLLASSIHAAGYATLGELRDAEAGLVRPDTYYGVGKVAAEALGAVFAARFSLTIVSARIASFSPAPANARAIGLWFSPADAVRLVEAALRCDLPGHHIVWGVSANTRGFLPLDPGRRIGFEPQDDAEAWAHLFDDHLIAEELADHRLAAGAFTDDRHPLGG
jgi:uronate dehydrogenase